MTLLKKNLYLNSIKTKQYNNTHTYNCDFHKTNNKIDLKKGNIYTVYILNKENSSKKIVVKEISGILIKKNKKHNTTNIHLVCLKKYNNIYISLSKEAPNIYLI